VILSGGYFVRNPGSAWRPCTGARYALCRLADGLEYLWVETAYPAAFLTRGRGGILNTLDTEAPGAPADQLKRQPGERQEPMARGVKAKEPPVHKSPLERTIQAKERGLARMEQKKVEVREAAERECAEIDKRIHRSRILLDAIKRGELKE